MSTDLSTNMPTDLSTNTSNSNIPECLSLKSSVCNSNNRKISVGSQLQLFKVYTVKNSVVVDIGIFPGSSMKRAAQKAYMKLCTECVSQTQDDSLSHKKINSSSNSSTLLSSSCPSLLSRTTRTFSTSDTSCSAYVGKLQVFGLKNITKNSLDYGKVTVYVGISKCIDDHMCDAKSGDAITYATTDIITIVDEKDSNRYPDYMLLKQQESL